MSRIGVARELWEFIRDRKKYVFLPLIIVLLLLALFALVAEIPVLTPFIYALF